MKAEKIKLVVDGKTVDRGKLTKESPSIVFYYEHSTIKEELSRGKSADQAAAEELERAAWDTLEAGLSFLQQLAEKDPEAAAAVKKDFFLAASGRRVTYADGEPVELEEFEEV